MISLKRWLVGGQDRREYVRLGHNFRAKIATAHLSFSIDGITKNLSQGGAFIKIKKWHPFQIHDQAEVTFFLPPEFSGHNAIIGLQGKADIIRLDRTNRSLALQFKKNFKLFERIDKPQR